MPGDTPRQVVVTTRALFAAAFPLTTDLWWDPVDPHAVTIWFHQGSGVIDWALSRELLATGLTMAAGEMDVRVEPFFDDVLLTVDNTRERAVFLFRGDVVAAFLADTYRQVPLGAEQILIPEPAYFTTRPGGSDG